MSKKILRGGIFKHGFLEPLDIKFESLDSLFHRSGLFIQIHFGVVWIINSRNFFFEVSKIDLNLCIQGRRLSRKGSGGPQFVSTIRPRFYHRQFYHKPLFYHHFAADQLFIK